MRTVGTALMLSVLASCAVADGDLNPTLEGAADGWGVDADPLLMPKSIVTYVNDHQWGQFHLEWHTERQWDRLPKASKDYAKKQGWTRADIQEGAAGNGLEFLAMHRMMIQMLVMEYPTTKKYFTGWSSPPTDPRDKHDPLPGGADTEFDADKAMAIDRLENDLGSFASDDELGLFIETSLRPTAGNPNARSSDKEAGIHNYVHNRFADPSSKIDIGDPSVNLQNKRFWRLHGWIDHVWTLYREQAGLTDDDPAYAAAMKKAMADMPMTTKGLGGPEEEPPPDELTKWFENNP